MFGQQVRAHRATITGMRVAQVNDIAYVGSTLTDTLRGLGVAVDLVEPWRPGAGIAYPWKLLTMPLRAWGLVAAGLGLRRQRYDLVHVHYARLGILGSLAGRPYLLHCHGSDIRGVTPASAWGREVAPFLHRASAVLYATPDLAPWVTAFRSDATFLPNPIGLPPLEVAGREPRRDLLVGVRLDPIKGLDVIESAVAELARRRPSTTITVVNQGPGVARVVAAAGATARVVEAVPHAAMPALLRAHRVALGQFHVGAIGNYELEAMAAGVPLVAHFAYPDAYGTPPPLLEASSGVPAAEQTMSVLDGSDARRRELAQASRAWIVEWHGAPAVAGRLLALYEQLTASR
jgi:glycosyltransferase involved in cell wall biosynthesis